MKISQYDEKMKKIMFQTSNQMINYELESN